MEREVPEIANDFCHVECRRYSLAGHVPDEESRSPLVKLQKVVKVAADFCCGNVDGSEPDPSFCETGLWREETLLEGRGDLELMPEPFTFGKGLGM